MYLRTLGLNKFEVQYWIQDFKSTNIPIMKCNESIVENKNDEHEDRHDEPKINKKCQKIASLKKFFDFLPTLPSHYCRKTSKKLFLQTDVKFWTQLYNVYKQSFQTRYLTERKKGAI